MALRGLNKLADANPEVREILADPRYTSREAVRRIADVTGGEKTSKSAVNAYRNRIPAEPVALKPATPAAPGTTTWDQLPDGGGEAGTVSDHPLEVADDWRPVFEKFNLDPEKFEIVEGTVRCSTWQQSRRTDDGDRDVVDLYSYRARFRLRTSAAAEQIDLDTIIRNAWSNPIASSPAMPLSAAEPTTFVVCWADMQLGKSEGGGVESTVKRFNEALDKTVSRIEELQADGRGITEIVVVNMGDPLEGCDGHYAQQTYTVELNLRDQLTLALNLMLKGLLTLESLNVPKMTFLSVLCNHGEWNRKGNKSFTDDADNAGGFLGDTLATLISTASKRPKDWGFYVPRDEMVLFPQDLSGVPVAFTHGHTMPQSSDNIKAENAWLQNQSLGLLHTTGVTPRLWVTAHRHHAMVLDFGPWHRIQCTALDGGSKWFYDSAGKWSTSGVTTFLVGKHAPAGFSDYLVL